MNFDLEKKEKEIQQTIFSLFGEIELEAIAAMESTAPAGLRETTLQLQRALAKTDWWSLGVNGEKITSMQAVDSAFARVSASFYLSLQYTRLFSELLKNNFSEELTGEIIGKFTSGEFIGALATLENSGQSLSYTSLKKQEGAYVLNGQKSNVINVSIADQLLVMARFEEGFALCLVKPDAEGVRRTSRVETAGLKGLTLANVIFNEVLLEAENVAFVSEKDVRNQDVQNNLIVSACANGLMYASLLNTNAHCKSFEVDAKPLAAKQGVRYDLAEMLTLVQAGELCCQRAAWALASENHEALVLSQCAASFTTEQVVNLSNMALNIMGVEGYKAGNVMSRIHSDAKGLGLLTTNQYDLKMKIADSLLEKY